MGMFGASPPSFARRIAASGTAFSPANLANLVGWWDFSDISTLFQDSLCTVPVASDGDVVGCVVDKSAAGNNLTQGSTTSKPLYRVNIQNGLPVVRFDGINDYLIPDNPPAVAASTYFIAIAKRGGGGTIDGYINTGPGGTQRGAGLYDFGGQSIHDYLDASPAVVTLTSQWNGTSVDIWRNHTVRVATINDAEHRANGVQRASDGAYTAPALSYDFIGVMSGGAFFGNVDIGELFMYNESKSAADMVRAEAFLGRWL